MTTKPFKYTLGSALTRYYATLRFRLNLCQPGTFRVAVLLEKVFSSSRCKH